MATIWKWFVIACVVWVLWYFGIIAIIIKLLGTILVLLGSAIMTVGNFLI